MGLRSAIAAGFSRVRTGGAGAAREVKSGGGFAGTLLFTGGDAGDGGERSFAGLARDGFMRNPVVYRCVRMIAENVAAVPLLLYDGAKEVEAHPVLDLLRAAGSGGSLVETVCGHLLLAGNAYVEVLTVDGEPRALHALRPDRVRIVPGRDGWPEAFEYRAGGSVRRIALGEEEPARLLHLKLFHPLDDGLGFAPLGAAGQALDLHNAAARWNRALLDNSARPSGALVYQPGDNGNLSPDQFDRLKIELEAGYAGAGKAGRPMLLEGGLDWKAMSLSPKDMDFAEAKNGAARDIALAFGVPPMLLGIPGDATYANYAEANRAFFRLTVLPLLGRLCAGLGGWLCAHHDAGGFRLSFDADRIEGLSLEREALWARVNGADFLDDDEKREAVGYGPRKGNGG